MPEKYKPSAAEVESAEKMLTLDQYIATLNREGAIKSENLGLLNMMDVFTWTIFELKNEEHEFDLGRYNGLDAHKYFKDVQIKEKRKENQKKIDRLQKHVEVVKSEILRRLSQNKLKDIE